MSCSACRVFPQRSKSWTLKGKGYLHGQQDRQARALSGADALGRVTALPVQGMLGGRCASSQERDQVHGDLWHLTRVPDFLPQTCT